MTSKETEALAKKHVNLEVHALLDEHNPWDERAECNLHEGG
jgi:hypothetical protein